MADTKYKINDYFFNFNTVFSFFSFLLIQLHIFPLYILFFSMNHLFSNGM